jgi:PAS domain-containing protein
VVASRWSLQKDGRGSPLATLETNNDITQHKRADAELRASEQKYRNIFQTVGVSIWEEDFSAVKAAIDALRAQGVSDFRRYLAEHPDFTRQAIALVRILDVNDATIELFGARNKDELLVSLHRLFLPETEAVFARELTALAEGQTSLAAETVLQTLQGERLDVLFTITFPAEPAAMNSVLVSIFDITERKRSQEALARAQADLAHVNRVSTLGELAASIAHEVTQPIAGVVTNADAALRWLARCPTLSSEEVALDGIIKDGKRAGEILGGSRLVKKAPVQKERLDINQAILEVVALTHSEVQRKGVTLQTQLQQRCRLSSATHPAAAGRAQLHPQRRRCDQRRGPVPTERGDQHREGFERRDRRGSRQRGRPRHGQRRSPVSAVLYDQGVRHGHGIVDLTFDRRSAWRARGGLAQRRCRRDLSVHLAGATSEGTVTKRLGDARCHMVDAERPVGMNRSGGASPRALTTTIRSSTRSARRSSMFGKDLEVFSSKTGA